MKAVLANACITAVVLAFIFTGCPGSALIVSIVVAAVRYFERPSS
jgi:hypothetical protein